MKISFVYQSLILINLIIIFDIIDTLKILNLLNINRHHDGLFESLSSSTPLLKGKVRNLHEKYFSQYVRIFATKKKIDIFMIIFYKNRLIILVIQIVIHFNNVI